MCNEERLEKTSMCIIYKVTRERIKTKCTNIYGIGFLHLVETKSLMKGEEKRKECNNIQMIGKHIKTKYIIILQNQHVLFINRLLRKQAN